MEFTSLNPYQRIAVVKGDDAFSLAQKLRELTMRFSIVGLGNDTDGRPYAMITGDLMIAQPKQKKIKGA